MAPYVGFRGRNFLSRSSVDQVEVLKFSTVKKRGPARRNEDMHSLEFCVQRKVSKDESIGTLVKGKINNLPGSQRETMSFAMENGAKGNED